MKSIPVFLGLNNKYISMSNEPCGFWEVVDRLYFPKRGVLGNFKEYMLSTAIF